MQIFVPRLLAVFRSHSVETLETFSKTALEYSLGRRCNLERLGNFLLLMTFEAHLKRHLLLVFVNHRNGQSETDDNEIDGRARCGDGRDPAALTTSLISNPRPAGASDSLCFSHGSDGIIRERIEILRVFACRSTGSPFVVDECANIFGGQQSLERV